MRALSALLFFVPCTMAAQARVERSDEEGPPRVVTTASRTARLSPDKAWVYVIVEGAAESAAEAAQRADRKLQTVTEAVKQLGARTELQGTVPLGVSAAPNFGGYPGQTAANQFVARHVLRVQPARVDQMMTLSTSLMSAGATSVTPPMFESNVADSVRRAKYSEAIAQARADAEAVAAAMGMRLGALVNVTTNAGPMGQSGQQWMNFGRPWEMMMSGVGMMPDVTVVAGVTLTYRLQPR
jgi:uncharacterized protein